MPACPDCGEIKMRKHPPYYVCTRCGLSFKPTEVQKAQDRAKHDIDQFKTKKPTSEEKWEKDRRKKRSYRNWYEGSTDEE